MNYEMVTCYWEIGRLIVEEEQRGEVRADYGARLIADISRRLTAEFGKGFDRIDLQVKRPFSFSFQIIDAVRRELSWAYYQFLFGVEKVNSLHFASEE